MSAASQPTEADRRHLDLALELAARGRGRTAPNPMVGAVVERDGHVVGRGHHVFEDGDHAEVVALREAGDAARGASVHVTLEPCSTTGRTGPCTRALVEAGVARVTACTADPDPRHRGVGFRALREAGVAVAVGHRRADALRLNAPFCTTIVHDRPHVTVKVAASLDGAIAARSGESRWITGPEARRLVHERRGVVDAILVGAGTQRADDPRLSVRLPHPVPHPPMRCVVDPSLRTNPSSRLLEPAAGGESIGPVLVACSEEVAIGEGARRADALREKGAQVVGLPRADGTDRWLALDVLLAELRRRGVLSLLVEGGGVTIERFLKAGLVDVAWWHVAPMLLGGAGTAAALGDFGAERLSDAYRLRRFETTRAGADLLVEAEVAGGFDPERLASELEELEELEPRGDDEGRACSRD